MKNIFFSLFLVVCVYLVSSFYPGWVLATILGIAGVAIFLGLFLYYKMRSKKQFFGTIASILVILDAIVLVVLAVISVFVAGGWLQGGMALVIALIGVGYGGYEIIDSRSEKPKKAAK